MYFLAVTTFSLTQRLGAMFSKIVVLGYRCLDADWTNPAGFQTQKDALPCLIARAQRRAGADLFAHEAPAALQPVLSH